MEPQGTSAIVAAYNEAQRIAAVLEALTRSPLLSEIIVVDDGSTDGTADVVRTFEQVILIQHQANQGKAAALYSAAARAQHDIFFFCDADLVGFTPEMVAQILNPVLLGTHDMSLGISGDFSQHTLPLVAHLTGQRALTRALWDTVESDYRVGFRIEVGLNQAAHTSGARVCKQVLPFSNTFKEEKYPLVEASVQRAEMNRDVVMALARAHFTRLKRKVASWIH